jgi:threonine/homoserine/homoserine lactone efflux protein
MGYQVFRENREQEYENSDKPKSLSKGIITNALSPHPYLFWLSIGTPTLVQASKVSFVSPILFIGGFYLILVGTKLALALLVGKSGSFLNNRTYHYVMNFLGLSLILFSFLLFIDGFKLL